MSSANGIIACCRGRIKRAKVTSPNPMDKQAHRAGSLQDNYRHKKPKEDYRDRPRGHRSISARHSNPRAGDAFINQKQLALMPAAYLLLSPVEPPPRRQKM